MAFINVRAQQRAKAAAKAQREAAKRRELLVLLRAAGNVPSTVSDDALARDAVAVIKRARANRATAEAAWSALERAEERARLERRLGCLARLRCGAVAVCRRPDALPPGAERLDVEQARAALAGARLRVVGHHGTASPDLHPDAFLRLAGPLLEVA